MGREDERRATIYIYDGESGPIRCHANFTADVARVLLDTFGRTKIKCRVDFLSTAIVLRPVEALPYYEKAIVITKQIREIEDEMSRVMSEARTLLGFRPTDTVKEVLEDLVEAEEFDIAYARLVKKITPAFAYASFIPKPEDFKDPVVVQRLITYVRSRGDPEVREDLIDIINVLFRVKSRKDAKRMLFLVNAFREKLRFLQNKMRVLEEKLHNLEGEV